MAKNRKDNEDQPDKNQGNADDSDNFGLPDLEYKPLDREAEPVPVSDSVEAQETRFEEPTPETTDYSYDGEEPSSKAPIFISLIIGVVVVVAGFLIYRYWYVPKAAKEKQEQINRELEQKRKEDELRAAQEKDAAERKRLEDEAAAKAHPAEGTIETLSERSRRWFVVVSSNIDDDLVMDYAKKLSAKGVSTKIIPPFGNAKFYRLAIADFGTFSEAQSSADASKAEYGSALWVIKY